MNVSPDTPSLGQVAPPQSGDAIDCAGARLYVHARSLATVVRVDGEIDKSNADLVARAINRYAELDGPLILDLSHLDRLAIGGFRALLVVDEATRQRFITVTGAAMRQLTEVITDHGLAIVDSVPEALQLIGEEARTRRRILLGLARR